MRTLLTLACSSLLAVGVAVFVTRKLGGIIMATTQELAASLSRISDTIDKVGVETSQTRAEIVALREQLASAGVDESVMAQVRSIEERLTRIDEMVVDAPVATPENPETPST